MCKLKVGESILMQKWNSLYGGQVHYTAAYTNDCRLCKLKVGESILMQKME